MKTATTLTLLLMAVPSFAGPLPDKLVMPTDVGKVVITTQPCGISYGSQKVQYEYHAYATELTQGMELIHPGCWHREGMSVNIHFPEAGVATYRADYFKPEGK